MRFLPAATPLGYPHEPSTTLTVAGDTALAEEIARLKQLIARVETTNRR